MYTSRLDVGLDGVVAKNFSQESSKKSRTFTSVPTQRPRVCFSLFFFSSYFLFLFFILLLFLYPTTFCKRALSLIVGFTRVDEIPPGRVVLPSSYTAMSLCPTLLSILIPFSTHTLIHIHTYMYITWSSVIALAPFQPLHCCRSSELTAAFPSAIIHLIPNEFSPGLGFREQGHEIEALSREIQMSSSLFTK